MILERRETLNSEADLSSIAALIGEPARAAMLTALMDGLTLPAGELAELAGVSPQTASSHLNKLLEGGLLLVESHGRHRYYGLRDASVAQALEALMLIAPARQRQRSPPDQSLCYARTCYDHLAGWLGVALCQEMLEQGWLMREGLEFRLTAAGQSKLEAFGVKIPSANSGKFARACLDWTERRHHLGGSLGRALTIRLLELAWLARNPTNRSLRLTEKGCLGFGKEFLLRL